VKVRVTECTKLVIGIKLLRHAFDGSQRRGGNFRHSPTRSDVRRNTLGDRKFNVWQIAKWYNVTKNRAGTDQR